MGKVFGIFHQKDEVEAPYHNPANGWWPKRIVKVYIPPAVAAKKRAAILDGLRRWQAILQNPVIDLTIGTTESSMEADIVVSFSATKPKVDGREVWAVTTLEPRDPAFPKEIGRALMLFWVGLSDNQQKDSAAHEGGHAWGIRGHSAGGVMDADIEVGSPNKWDAETLLIAYRERNEMGRKPT